MMNHKSRNFRTAVYRRVGAVTAMALWLLPLAAQACPRCVDATPYRSGLQMAIAVLLPLPFALGYGLYRFIRDSVPSEKE